MALKGIKVLELAGLAPGPLCGTILADFGASVIRVDKIKAPALDYLGHGKRSIALNLKSERGINIFKKLSDESDVVIDTYRKGVMEKLKIGPEELMATNKRLIYARLTGYGQSGSYANMAGHDINYLGLSGLLSLFGRYDQKPTPPGNLAADFGGGSLMCAFGIILALYERTRSNVGQVIDVSMVEGAAYLGSWFFRSHKIFWRNPRGKNFLDTGSHWYDTYETKDKRYMCVGALEPQFYEIFLKKLGLSSDEVPQFENFEENRRIITEIFKTKTQAEWCAIFDGSDACVTPMLDIENVTSHIHNNQRQTFTTMGDDIIPNPAPRLSRTPGISVGGHKNTQPGEDTIQILTELKLQSNEIDDLLANGVAYQTQHTSNL
ncbi:PREDICTED: alpha-methylacyl-CoA racemase [Vollenhovia emeryi]|uniref:alpha-methylacyl-CoA racemase n=1 Tax=Vollenhovia emeryi TaxID=411798 RepID=UPI0005F457F9|nr:PREDICTED: alpha-methylacyl-CoA racemase [Vollenhovia emeryi]XP_011874020.1 PREDICTED: alpha-methylacyl-CoA racemase [Vollenhovia emeryi]